MATIKLRRDTAANWASVNPILMEGEMALETDNFGKDVEKILPTSDWLSQDFGHLTNSSIWVDIRCIVQPSQKVLSVRFLLNLPTTVDINIYFVTLTGGLLKTMTISKDDIGESLDYTYNFDDDQPSVPFYVAIDALSIDLKGGDGNSYGRYVNRSFTALTPADYTIAYAINVLGFSSVKYKMGNGIARYNSLPYINPQIVEGKGSSKILAMSQKSQSELLERAEAIIDIFKPQEIII